MVSTALEAGQLVDGDARRGAPVEAGVAVVGLLAQLDARTSRTRTMDPSGVALTTTFSKSSTLPAGPALAPCR